MSSCSHGGGHIDAGVPWLYPKVEQMYRTTGWKTYADDMDTGN